TDAVKKSRLEHDVENRIAGRHGQRISAISRTMRAGRHAFRGTLGGKACAKRKSAADTLADRHDVGHQTRLFIGEQAPGAADAGLYFIENQKQAPSVTEFAQALQEAGRWYTNPNLTLNGFN